ncbi:MAG TPA: Wzz/FepE/Etk N-terminal domain-containing protein [Terracidiphilus sp.]|nr:Wzz/FepE/Etk N-terminal domain-containing protein [Terracidiphilus sp.]
MFADVQEPPAATPAHAPSTPEMLIRTAWRRRRLVYLSAAVIAVIAVLVALLLPASYTSTTVLLPPQQESSAGAALLGQLGTLGAMASLSGGGAAGALGLKNPNDLQVALIKSRSVEDAMIARFQLEALYHRRYLSAARHSWERHTRVENGLKDGLLRLSVTDRDPRRAAEMANGWVEEYQRFSSTLAVTEAAQRRLFYEHELTQARADLERAEDNMRQTQLRTGVIEIEGQAHAMIAQAELLRSQVAAKQVEVRAMREFAAPQNPDLMRAEQELATMQAQLAAMDVADDRRVGNLAAPRGRLSDAGLAYIRAERELKFRETIVEVLSKQYEIARVDEAKQGSLIQVVDPAQIPDRPNNLSKWLTGIGGVVLAFPIGLVLAWLAEAVAAARSWRRSAGSWSAALDAVWGGSAR